MNLLNFIRIRRLFFTISLSFVAISVSAIESNSVRLTPSQSKAAFIYNFFKHISWPNEASTSYFRVGVYGKNPELLQQLKYAEKQPAIRNKRLKIISIDNLKNASSLDVIYVDTEHSKNLPDIAQNLVKTQTLLISDDATDKANIMINFISPGKNKVAFEVNRSNIIFEGLKISKEIIILGGSEIDVAKLYNEMMVSIRKLREKFDEQQTIFDIYQQQVNEQKRIMGDKNKEITNLREKAKTIDQAISDKNKAISDKEKTLKESQKKITKNQEKMQQQQQQLLARQQALQSNQEKLSFKEKEINELENRILINMKVLTEQQQLIDEQTSFVKQQEDTINQQKRLVIITLIVATTVVGLLLTLFILHKQKRALFGERRIRRAVESSLHIKSDFITAISHELRTPMNAIYGGLQIIHNSPPEQINLSLPLIDKGCEEMMQLINDILAYTEVQSGQLQVNKQSTPMNAFLKALEMHYRKKSKDKNLDFRWHVDTSIPEWLSIDSDKIHNIISKLLDNAIKFTPSGGINVTISFSHDDNTCFNVSVRDTGIGIAENDQTEIFEPFRQKEGGFQRRFGGLGVGLSICQEFIVALDGDLTIHSNVGEGSCFSFSVPTSISEKPRTRSLERHEDASLPVLIVEDNRVNQKVMQKMLEKLGYQSLIASQGEEALALLEQHCISVILMDLQMPVMDGFTCTQKIRERKDKLKDTPIIAVTANLMEADKARCTRAGMNDYLKKPVKLDELGVIMHQYLGPTKPKLSA